MHRMSQRRGRSLRLSLTATALALGSLAALALAAGWAASANAEKIAESPPPASAAQAPRPADLQLDPAAEAVLKDIRKFWERKKIVQIRKPDFPAFAVPPRKEELEFFPCMDCHEDDNINIPVERTLTEEHESIVLDHGGGRFWCLTCHNLKNMDVFRSMKEEPIDFNRPYLLCGQCHSPRQKDWYFGGHGKRIGTWSGKKILLSCTECHNPHSPSIKPRPPDPPPKRHKGPDGFLVNLRKLGLWKALGPAEQ